MLSILSILLFLAMSVHALQVTSPDSSTVWLSKVANNITWTHDGSDPANFTITLITRDASSTILLALVNTTQDFVSVPPPSDGFPVGTGLEIKLVPDTQNLTTVLAKSAAFNIAAGAGHSTTSQSIGPTPTSTTLGGTTSQSGGSPAETSSSSSSSSGSSNVLIPPLRYCIAIGVAALWY